MVTTRSNTASRGKSRRSNAGLTLVELLIIIAVIGVLTALLMPMCCSRGGVRSIRTLCLTRIKILNLGVYNYATENRDRLPQMQPDNWLWDMPVAVAGALQTNGTQQKEFYDPAFQEMSAMWNSGTNSNRPYRTIGYTLTFPGTAGLIQSNSNPAIVPQPMVITGVVLPEFNPARRVSIAGATISVSGEGKVTNRTSNHYTGIQVGNFKARSAHLDSSGKMPTGDNVAMLDGSGQWRKFTNMIPRTTRNSPVFWW